MTPESLKFEEKSELERREDQERVETQSWICKYSYRSAKCRDGLWNNTQVNPKKHFFFFSKNADELLWIKTRVNPKKPFFYQKRKRKKKVETVNLQKELMLMMMMNEQ